VGTVHHYVNLCGQANSKLLDSSTETYMTGQPPQKVSKRKAAHFEAHIGSITADKSYENMAKLKCCIWE
jgi:hypothetical protein